MNWLRGQTTPRNAPIDRPLSLRQTLEDKRLAEAWAKYERLKKEILELRDENHDHRRSET